MLNVEELRVSFDSVQALAGVDLDVAEGERMAVLGPSGSGKSTVLRTIAGVQQPEGGRVLLDGKDLAAVPPHRRGIGLMLQEGALFPHRDVAGNVSFGLRMLGIARDRRAERTAEMLTLVGLSGFEHRPIGTLSGGERQRVALARALAPEPRVLLLDEPLGSLDGPLRERLAGEIAELSERLGLTVIHVTHDVAEAFTIGDRVAMMRAGRVIQVGTPDELWARPVDPLVARFLGRENVREKDGQTVLIPAEAIRLGPGDDAVVLTSQRRGQIVRLLIRVASGEELIVVTTELDHPRTGDRVGVKIDTSDVIQLGRGPSAARG
ncbi:MAG: ABC transporter ATP-binding protein [Actinobacteria bacterium]|nr:ABC transporter ATP-binding protein [Actinomycetota bacterium]